MADKKPKIDLPNEFPDEVSFLHYMRMEYAADEAYDYENRRAGVEDLQFLVGEQWDPATAQRRIAKRQPVLTINRLPAFVAQVLGARLQNETQIKILPDTSGDKEVARIRQGLMRNLQKQSRAELAFDNALQGCVCGGIGNFQLDIDYESDEAWHQSINIRPIADHFSVVWDRSRTDPTGSDAKRCFVVESMPRETFELEYPWATPTDVISNQMPAELIQSDWYSKGYVRIVNYWQMRERKRTIALMQNGETNDITDIEDPRQLQGIMKKPNGEPYVREVYRLYARMYRCSGADILEGPYDLPIDRVPIFRVPGWEVRIGGIVHRWGLIRHMKDPQRLHNFWRSAIAEKLQKAPKATWMAADTAVSGREDKWRNSNVSDDPLLIWNAESGQKPDLMPPQQMEQALLAQAEITEQDLKDVSNLHEANLGMPSNEVSGRALDKRTAIGETGTVLYHSNLTKAIEECGRVVNQLIPIVYDTPRVIRILGEDAEPIMQSINQQTDGSPDITLGKYSVTVSTGPSYKTKLIEQAENMLSLATAMPQVLGVSADLIVEAQDWPKADRIAERLRMGMDPSMLTESDMTPAVQQAMQQRAQQQKQQVEAAVKEAMAEHLKTMSEAAVNAARARHYDAQATAIPTETQNETIRAVAGAAAQTLGAQLEAIELATQENTPPQEQKNVERSTDQ